jgi:hypothetical protein
MTGVIELEKALPTARAFLISPYFFLSIVRNNCIINIHDIVIPISPKAVPIRIGKFGRR